MNTLKRGQGMSTYGEWNDPKAEWERWKAYLPNGKEVYVGQKVFYGEVFNVFKCLDDSYLAQDEKVCVLPYHVDPMKIISVLPDEDVAGNDFDVKIFRGKNWKLSSDKKWEDVTEYINLAQYKSVGTKEFNGKLFTVYQYHDGFIASFESDGS